MKKHIPNTLTCCNLISGCIATYSAFLGDYPMALLFIVIGAVFDFFDGMTARLLHVSSPIGKELDSLADCVTFGFAPSAIIFDFLSLQHIHNFIVPFLAFIMAASLMAGWQWQNMFEPYSAAPAWTTAAVLLMMLVSCYLLVSEIPMFALKFKHWGWKGNEVKYLFLLTCIPMLLLLGIGAFAAIIAWYVILSVVTNKRPLTHN